MIKFIPHSSTYIPKEYSNFIGEYIDLSDKNVLDISTFAANVELMI